MNARSHLVALLLAALIFTVAGCSGGSSGGAVSVLPPTSYSLSGDVRYQDIEYAEYGWVMVSTADGLDVKQVYKPVRTASVDLLDSDGVLLTTTATDQHGHFSFVDVSLARAPKSVRVMAASAESGTGAISIRNLSGATYAATFSLDGVDLAVPLAIDITKASGVGGAFNMLDVYQSAYEFVASHAVAAILPTLNVYWKNSDGTYTCSTSQSCPQGSGIYVLSISSDQDEYDDDVLWHEFTHFIEYSIGATDSPGGFHTFFNNTLDLPLAWSEGHADYLQTAIKKWLRATHPERLSIPVIFAESWYIDTSSSGGILLKLDMANPDPTLCGGIDCYRRASNEIAIAKTLWMSNTAFGESAVWNSFAGYLPMVTTSQRNMEPFWDGLLIQAGVTEAAAYAHFSERGIDYGRDGYEGDEAGDVRPAFDCTAAGSCVEETHTLYKGSLMSDVDVIPLNVAAGLSYTITTSALTNGADTYLELLDSDGITLLVANDDQADCGESGLPACSNNGSWFSSRVVYSSLQNKMLYVRVSSTPYLSRWIGAGAYGGYTLSVTAQ